MPIPDTNLSSNPEEKSQSCDTNFIVNVPRPKPHFGLKSYLPNTAYRLVFVASISRWKLQARAASQFFWRTVRTDGFGTSPIWFLTQAEAFEYLIKLGEL